MNYRKRKKIWTTRLRKLNEELDQLGNPLNMLLNGQIKYIQMNIQALKDLKNANKKSKT